MKHRIKIILSLICLLFFGVHPALAQESSVPNVLVLHSYHKSLSWVESIEKGIISEFKKKKSNAALRFEYMDTKRINRSDYLQSLFELYKVKFKNTRFNIIICSDNNSLNFLLSHHHMLFPDTPVVFCGINNFRDNMLVDQDLFTGTIEEIDFRSTLDIAVKLHPKTRQIIFYGDDSPTYHANKALLDKIIPAYKDRLKFYCKNNFNLKQIQNDIQTLDPNSLILPGSTIRTETGGLLSFEESVKKMEAVSHVPIYGCWDFFLGHGLIGGRLVSGFAQGKTAADIALRILAGEPVSDIPVIKKSPNQYMFDNDQLKKFNINPSMLPKDVVIINRELSFYAKNKKLIIPIIVSIAVLTFIILILSLNIRTRKRFEQELEKGKERYRLLVENQTDMIVKFSLDGRLQFVSPSYCKTFRKTQTELIGEAFMPLIHKDDQDNVGKAIKSVFNPPYTVHVEERALTKDGWRWQSWLNTAVLDQDNKVEAVIGVGRDIDDRKKTELALIKSEEQFRDLFNSITDLIHTQDMEGRFTTVNPAMQRLFGYSKEEFLGRRAADFMEPELKSGFKTRYLEKVKKQGSLEGVGCYFTKTGEKIYIEYKSSLVKPESGKPYISGIGRDVTERILSEERVKKLQKQIVQAQKMESIGTLAGGIAHDFNNILFPIVGHTEMLLEDVPEGSSFKKSLNEIYSSTLRAKNLVEQILTFSRQESSELKLVKMQPIIKEALKLMRSTIPTTIDIQQNISKDCGVIKADPIQIHQLVMNFTTNAYHSMEETGGELKVSLKQVKLGEHDVEISSMVPGVYICLTIADTGIGMDKELIEKIFDPFFTTKEVGKGTGMGLSVVHGIVKSLNGTIQVHSEPGKGTEFNIYLPVVEKAFEEQKIQAKEPIQRGTEKILFVDDEEEIIAMEEEILKRIGYQVSSYTSSIEALEVFRANPGKFDLVITDMAMPGMSGDRLSAELTKIRSDIPILLCTGFSETMSEEKAASLGIKGFLMKPVVMKDLSQKIRKVLDKN
ncbi:MAG: PAS domain S-box protein [Desulfobacteraceae bacterium]|nr:PAS domain S-box protein [Desulfobacteraceae bacterium]